MFLRLYFLTILKSLEKRLKAEVAAAAAPSESFPEINDEGFTKRMQMLWSNVYCLDFWSFLCCPSTKTLFSVSLICLKKFLFL